MNIKSVIVAASLASIWAWPAAAQTWLPPKEIQSKTDAGAAPAATSSPAAQAAKSSDAQKGKVAKLKDCKAQSLAKGLHGAERKKFLDSCKNS